MRTLGPVAVGLLLAGCLDPTALLGADETPAEAPTGWAAPLDWAIRALPSGDGHAHGNLAQHRNLSTPSFEVVGWDPLVTDYHGSTTGSYYCGEINRGPSNRSIAWVNSFTTDVAMVGVDVTDPANPVKVGELALPALHVYDLSVTPDGRYVVLGTSQLTNKSLERDPPRNLSLPALSALEPQPRCRAGVAGPRAAAPEDATPYPGGLILVDVQDPANPRVVDFVPQPTNGVHSVFVTTIDDRTLILSAVVNPPPTFGLVPPAVTLPWGSTQAISYFSFGEIVDGKIEMRSAYRPPPSNPAREPLRNGHLDGTISKHPLTGQLLAYLADWDGGLSIVDVTDLARPTPVSRWTEYRFGQEPPFGTGFESGNVHHAVALPDVWRDGRHYTFLGQEFSSRPRDTPTGHIFVLDTTDPAAPAWVSSWTLPVDLVWHDRLLFSLHYFHLQGTTLFVTAYHAGMWAVDYSNLSEPRTLGVFLPGRESPQPAPDSAIRYAPQLMEVLPGPDGTLVTFDDGGGAYTVRFHPEVRVPPVEEWPIIPPDATATR